jgi:hypothetical protein
MYALVSEVVTRTILYASDSNYVGTYLPLRAICSPFLCTQYLVQFSPFSRYFLIPYVQTFYSVQCSC